MISLSLWKKWHEIKSIWGFYICWRLLKSEYFWNDDKFMISLWYVYHYGKKEHEIKSIWHFVFIEKVLKSEL